MIKCKMDGRRGRKNELNRRKRKCRDWWLVHGTYSRDCFCMLGNSYLLYKTFIILKTSGKVGKK